MAGTFVAQTKIRPGAYIVFKGTKESNSALGRRGIVAIPMELSWGGTSKLTAHSLTQAGVLVFPVLPLTACFFEPASLSARSGVHACSAH